MRTITRSIRILSGIAALSAILAGPPIAFWTFRDVLVPRHVYSVGDALATLTAHDTGQTFLTLLTFAGIVAWLQIVAAALVEATGHLRAVPVRRVAGIGWARKIIVGVLLLMTGSATAATAAEPTTAYIVRPGDSLMRIAADQLGDAHRYTEIYDLNHSRRQPDGESLRDVALIKPGWQLELPAKAAGDYAVRPGDTLTSIARDRLGNASRYREILQLNNKLHDPDHIRAGATLQLPTAPPTQPKPSPPPTKPATPPPPSPSPLPDPPATPENRAQLSPPGATEAGNTPLVVAGAAGLAVAAVLTAVGIRRLRAARRQSPAETEHQSAASPIDNLDRALRQLARNAEIEGSKLPRVRMVRLGRERITLCLDEPAEPIAPFTAAATGAEWQLTEQFSSEGHDDADAPYPFLTGLGHDTDGSLILLSLDHAGALLLDGAPKDIAEVGLAIALELSSSPWAQEIQVDLVGGGPDFGDAEYLEHHRSVDEFLACTADAADRRPHVVVVIAPLAQEDADHLATSEAAADIVAVVAGADPNTVIPGAWEIDVRKAATLVEQLEVRIALQRVPQGETADLDGPVAADSTETVVRKPQADRDGAETAPETDPQPVATELRLLGPVSLRGVDHHRVEGKKINRLTELAAFLALNPGAHADKISEQLGTSVRPWSAATRQGYISRLRTWLGHAPDGELYLPNIDARNGGYRLGPLPCDWFRFQHLVRTADSGDRVDRLQEALDLVEGIPLSDVPHGRYEWAAWHQRDMIDQIVAVAHTLAVAYREAGDLTRARRAAARGLRAEPVSELLSRELLRIEHAAGNLPAIRSIAEKLQTTSMSLQSPLDTETIELLAQLVQ